MTITRKKIRLQCPQIQRQLPNPMRAINETQNPKLATDLDDLLKRKPDTRHANHRLKHRHPHIQPLRPRLRGALCPAVQPASHPHDSPNILGFYSVTGLSVDRTIDHAVPRQRQVRL